MAGERKLHLGCGLIAPLEWDNIDRSPNIVLDRVRAVKFLLRSAGVLERAHMTEWPKNVTRYDVTRGIRAGDEVVAEIYTSHMLEHLYLDEAAFVIQECHRVLKRGGILRLALPDSDLLAKELLQDVSEGFPDSGSRFNSGLIAFPASPPTRGQRCRTIFSSNVHRWQPTRTLIRRLLTDAGFTEFREEKYRVGRLSDLEIIEQREESIFFEAEK